MTIGQRIKAARKKAKKTQAEVGDFLGVSASMVAQWENGSRNPKRSTLQKIAESVNVSDWKELVPEEMMGAALAADVIDGSGLKIAPEVKADSFLAIDKIPTDELISEIKFRAKADPNIINELRKAAINTPAPSDEDLVKIAEADGIPTEFVLSDRGKAGFEKVRLFFANIDQDGFLDFSESIHDFYLKTKEEPSETDE